MLRLVLLSSFAVIIVPTIANAANGDNTVAAAAPADIIVTARRLDAARDSIRPNVGASTYSLSKASIDNIPGGENQPLNDIILQLPGISQDQFGQFHVRDDHNGLEYRVNGVILPEGISVFGQSLSPQLIDKLDLITGALPAQYGLHTAGIIDITTKRDIKNGATLGFYGGSHGTVEPTLELQGRSGGTSYFFSGNYTRNNLGIENVNSNRNAVHDDTSQYNGFGYIDHILGANDRLSLTFGYSNQHYQIPNQVGLQPDPMNHYSVNGVTAFPSEQLNETQLQSTGFGILSLLHTSGNLTLQASFFGRTSALDYHSDVLGELLFNGLAQAASKRDFSVGTQIEMAYKLGDAHTLRAGLIVQNDHSVSRTATNVFPTDIISGIYLAGNSPIVINDGSGSTQTIYSTYLQDEWKLSPQLVLNYGARFDENDGVRNERQLSPRVNVVFTPSKTLSLHAGYARYFSPAPFELVATESVSKLDNTVAAAPHIDDTPRAEREHYFDVGFLQKIGQHFSIGLDGYYRLSTNLVDEGQFGAPIVLTPFNYAKGRVRGFELTTTYGQGGWSVYGNLAYAKAQGRNIVASQFNFSPANLAYIAQNYIYLDHDQTWTGSGGVSYHFRTGSLSGTRLSADLIYGSGLRRALNTTDRSGAPISIPNGAHIRSYTTVNGSIGHKFTTIGIDVHFDIINVFDMTYKIRDGTGIGVGAPSFGARRGFFGGITKQF